MDRHMSPSGATLPHGFYLGTCYEDARRGEVRERQYADSGEVWLVVNGERSLWCTLDPVQVAAARESITASGITEQPDILAPEDAHDLATMSYEWRLGDRTGRVVDAAYPLAVPEAFDRLEERLAELEAAAG